MPLNKLAIVLQHGSTGARRYAYRLIEGLCEARPNLKVSLYMSRKAMRRERDHSGCCLPHDRVRIRPVPSLKALNRSSRWKHLVSIASRCLQLPSMGRWAREVEQHDVAFFAWPYGIDVPKLSLPMAFIPHDLNYTHFVGAFVDSPSSWHHTRALHAEWLRRAHPVVSSQGIADELRNEFPLSQTPTEVIPISHLSSRGKLDDATAREIVQGLGVQNKYVLCLNNVSAHKNLGQVLSGFHYVQKKHPDLQLVLSGPGTSPLNGECRSPFYLDLDVQADSILGLGNRTDLEVKALIQCAIAVVNGSLYEAGNGSGLDAWALGTPVVMSAIPSFLEHLRVLDVRAETFHPRCCFEIADALLRVLDNPARAQHNAKISQIAMQHYPWSRVGERYAEFFERIARIHTEHDFVQAKAA